MQGPIVARRLLEAGRRLKRRIDPREPGYRLPRWRPADPSRPLRVGIVGGGISGLVTARLLRDQGHHVVVFEARNRVGGRIHTLEPATGGSSVREAGATRFTDTDSHTYYWVRRLGIGLLPMYPESGRLVHLDGSDRLIGRDVSRLSQHETHSLIAGADEWGHQYRSPLDTVVDVVGNSLTKPAWHRLDQGSARLPLALAETLGHHVRLDSAVTEVRDRPEGIVVSTARAMERFDRVVVTAPASILSRIRFEPPLAADKQQTLSEIETQASLRVFVTTRSSRWMTDGVCGWGRTENGIEVWTYKPERGAEHCVSVVYAQGGPAKTLITQHPQDRERQLLALLVSMFPGIDRDVIHVSSHCWNDDPWAEGAQSVNRGTFWKTLARPQGRLHFAGEYSTPDGWVDGCIDSAYRVVGEICGKEATGRPGTLTPSTHPIPEG